MGNDDNRSIDMTPPSLPPTGLNSEFRLRSTMEEIENLDKEFWEVTKGLPVRTGSILRVPSSSYGKWGIEITPDNMDALERIVDSVRQKDKAEREQNEEISRMGKTELSKTTKNRMARMMGHIVKEVLRVTDDGRREIRICDLAAGNGLTSAAVLNAMIMDPETAGLVGRTSFYLIDYSGARLDSARKNLGQFKPGDISVYPTNDERFLSETGVKFDVVTSLCHFHKKPFMGHLQRIKEVLAENGALISGDWHSSLCNRPHHIYQLFEEMGIEKRRLDMFRKLFGSLLAPESEREVRSEEVQAIRDHKSHWLEVWRRLPEQLRKSPKEPRLYVLGAFETSRARAKKLEDNGFTLDDDKLRTAFPGAKLQKYPFRMLSRSDHAAVILCRRK